MRNRAWFFARVLWCLLLAHELLPVSMIASSAPGELTDAELERVLSKGKITRTQDIGAGVTKPMRLWIERDGVTVSASYKDVDYQKRGVTRFAGGNAELGFSDSYRYERAAYLLDRVLGLDMVPVTVIRQVYRQPGAVTLWIGDSLTEEERVEQGLATPSHRSFASLSDFW